MKEFYTRSGTLEDERLVQTLHDEGFFDGVEGFELDEAPRVYVLLEEKPHVDLERIFGMTREQVARHVAIIGDNDSKDMELARRYGCVGVHAAYGAADPALGKRLDRFAPPRVKNRSMQTDAGGVSGGRIFTANSAREILGFLF